MTISISIEAIRKIKEHLKYAKRKKNHVERKKSIDFSDELWPRYGYHNEYQKQVRLL